MDLLLTMIIGLCAVIALFNWKLGLVTFVVTAIVQDPLRKIVPDEPVYIVTASAAVFFLAFVGAVSRDLKINPNQIQGWRAGLSLPAYSLIIWILAQTVHSLIAYNSPLVSIAGLISYLGPIPAVILGYQFALRSGPIGIQKWLGTYSLLAGIALLSILIEYAGIESELLGQVRVDMKIFDLGTVLIGKSGIFRSTEVAAWHATAVACLAFIWLTSPSLRYRRIGWGLVIIVACVGLGILTGRRKSIVMVLVFLGVYMVLISIFFRRYRYVLIGSTVAVTAILLLTVNPFVQEQTASGGRNLEEYQLFVERGKSVFEEIPDRVLSLTLGQAEWAQRTAGSFGAGVGIGTSGARHFGNVGERFGGIGEGGVGKIFAELGIPGLVLMGWLLLALLRHVWRTLKYAAPRSDQVFRLASGLVAFLVGNISAFLVGTQIFSDLFVLICLGLIAGFLLATPTLAEKSRDTARMKTRPSRSGDLVGYR